MQRRNSMTSRSKGVSKTQWYDRSHHHQDPNRLNSRHSLETDEDISTDSDDDIFHQENSSVHDADHHDGNVMNKLFHSTPTLSKNSMNKKSEDQQVEENSNNFRARVPTNEKLEKYKFMLINIEPDADILDPGTFALVDDEEEDSYLGFEFNDYPSEVLYSSYQHHPIPGPHPSGAAAALSAESKPNTQWLRRSFEQLSADAKGLERCKTTNASISLSTGNLLEKSEISLNPANRQPTEKLSSHNQEPR